MNDPLQIVMVTKGITPKPKFHRARVYPFPFPTAYCGIRETEGDIFIQMRHAEKFAEPCKSKKCFG